MNCAARAMIAWSMPFSERIATPFSAVQPRSSSACAVLRTARNAEADPATGYLLESLVAAIAAGDPAAQDRIADFLAGRAAKVK